jgi:hypothetical protein
MGAPMETSKDEDADAMPGEEPNRVVLQDSLYKWKDKNEEWRHKCVRAFWLFNWSNAWAREKPQLAAANPIRKAVGQLGSAPTWPDPEQRQWRRNTGT